MFWLSRNYVVGVFVSVFLVCFLSDCKLRYRLFALHLIESFVACRICLFPEHTHTFATQPEDHKSFQCAMMCSMPMSHSAGFMVHGLVRDRSAGFLVATGLAVGAAHPQFHDSDGFDGVCNGYADGAAHPQFRISCVTFMSERARDKIS